MIKNDFPTLLFNALAMFPFFCVTIEMTIKGLCETHSHFHMSFLPCAANGVVRRKSAYVTSQAKTYTNGFVLNEQKPTGS